MFQHLEVSEAYAVRAGMPSSGLKLDPLKFLKIDIYMRPYGWGLDIALRTFALESLQINSHLHM